MTAVNHAGWQVESYCRHTGWRRASKVYTNYFDVLEAAAHWPVAGIELRVMEALDPAPLTPAQWITEAVKRVKRFYRINERKAT